MRPMTPVCRQHYIQRGVGAGQHPNEGIGRSLDQFGVALGERHQQHGWPIVAEYSDGVSASRFGRKARKEWHQLLEDLDEGLLDVIITWEPSRADRDLET